MRISGEKQPWIWLVWMLPDIAEIVFFAFVLVSREAIAYIFPDTKYECRDK